ncbi:MAG: hypothetical protein WKF84_08475 [Pyrinomonadaceae bacterium]
MTVAFFNYFTRMAEALNLPVEPWALSEGSVGKAAAGFEPPAARIGLISDEEIACDERGLGGR